MTTSPPFYFDKNLPPCRRPRGGNNDGSNNDEHPPDKRDHWPNGQEYAWRGGGGLTLTGRNKGEKEGGGGEAGGSSSAVAEVEGML
jgi:hypothetical protein